MQSSKFEFLQEVKIHSFYLFYRLFLKPKNLTFAFFIEELAFKFYLVYEREITDMISVHYHNLTI